MLASNNFNQTPISPEHAQLYNLIIKANKTQTEEIKSEIQNNIKTITANLENTNKEVEYLKKRCVNLERESRKNNLIIFGLKILETESLLNSTLKTLNRILEKNIKEEDINNIYKIGKSNNPPISVKFVSYLKKISLFQDKEKLARLKEYGLTITNDLCPEDREEQKVLRRHLKIARAQNYDAKIKGYTLFINNESYTIDDLRKIENKTESENNSEESAIEEEEEESESRKDNPEPQRGPEDGESSKSEARTAVEKKTAKATKRKRRKTYQYSPKNTRSSKNN